MNPLPDDPPSIEALFGGRPPLPRAATLEELDKIVENSSEKNRNFFIAYLGLLVYVQAIVFATTDLKLLVDTEGLKLPIIDLNVPLVGFYVVVPIFVIALHFNFLQNLESHHYKLMRWQEAHPGGQVPRGRIQPFLFDYATLETGSQMERWVRWANSLLVLNLAPITLGLLLWRYTDRQETWVTVWHYLAFVFDGYLVWKLRVALLRNRAADVVEAPVRGWRRWLSPVATAGRFLRDVPRHGLRGGFGLFLLTETLVTVAVSVLPSEAFVAYVLPITQRVDQRAYRTVDTVEAEQTRVASLLLPRIAIDSEETVWKPDSKALEVEAKMAGGTDWVKYFNEKGMGFRPSTSNLRLAVLRGQYLPRAQLHDTKLDGANLWAAQLQGANLESARLQGANLEFAQLQGADLEAAQLQGADLEAAQLQGAVLRAAKLQGTDLRSARLQGTDLRSAQLQGANLESAQLQGAALGAAQLQGAALWAAQLQGANLERAQLQGADLEAAQLQGADLGSAELQGVYLEHAELQGADLEWVPLEGALLWETALRGTTLPSSSGVWRLDPPFADSVPDWKALARLAESLPEGGMRTAFSDRIKQAEARKDSPATPAALTHDPGAVHRSALPDVCLQPGPNISRETRLVAVQGIRRNYRHWNYHHWKYELNKNSEFQTTLTEIDRTLCTLPACADLKDDIEGLDCGPFAAAKPSTESKR